MRRRTLIPAAAAMLLAARRKAYADAPRLTIFAAASLTDVMKTLGAQWTARTGQGVTYSFASSSTLARQIEQGAPADLFASADQQWMDELQQRQLIVDGTRVSPVGNSLVLIAPADQAAPVALTQQTDLLKLLGADGRIATGDPAHVPVGIYAKAALTWMGQWDAIAPRLARADDVRGALLLVERGETPYGIVYGTDAAVAPGVTVVGTFPAESHAPVLYPFALLKAAAAKPGAAELLRFLAGPEARPAFERYGFSVAAQGT